MSGAVPSSGGSAPALTKARAKALLHDLLAGLKLKGPKKKAYAATELQMHAGYGSKEPLNDVASCVQRDVLPHYGFEDGDRGMAQLWQAMEPLVASDPLLKELAEAVRCELQKSSRVMSETEPEDQETITLENLCYVKPGHWMKRRAWIIPRVFIANTWSVFVDLHEGMTVCDMRKQLLPQFNVLKTRLRLQEWVDGKLHDLEATASAARVTGMYLAHTARPSGSEQPLSVTKAQLMAMQRECLVRFSEPDFQTDLQTLINTHRRTVSCFGSSLQRPLLWTLPGRADLVQQVTKEVWPKYGMERGLKNQKLVTEAYENFIHDSDMVYLVEAMNERLAFPPQMYDIRRLTF